MARATATMTTHKGVYYFSSPATAAEWATANGWPTTFIRSFGRGYAVQAGNSANYAGPGETPTPYTGGIKAWEDLFAGRLTAQEVK